MPTYVYKFIDTGETIEVQQSFTDPSLTEAVHPATGATMPVKKVFTPVGVTFKGGGFYKTDSRGGSAKSSTAASSNGSADGGSTKESASSTGSSSDTGSSASATSSSSPAGSSATSTPSSSG